MYELLCRSSERPWAPQPKKLEFVPERGASKPLILHMQENRSHLTQEARVCFSVVALLFVVTSIGPALHGHWLVPAFSILAMAGLTIALERHGKSRPAGETLELAEGKVRQRDSAGLLIDLCIFARGTDAAFGLGLIEPTQQVAAQETSICSAETEFPI